MVIVILLHTTAAYSNSDSDTTATAIAIRNKQAVIGRLQFGALSIFLRNGGDGEQSANSNT